MKISKKRLKEIIKEEFESVLSEEKIEEGIFDMFKKKKKATPEPEPEPEDEEEIAAQAAEQAYQRKIARENEPKFRPPEEVRREIEKEKERQAAFSRELDRKHRARYASDFDVPPGGYGRYQGSGQGSRSSAESAPWNESKKK